MERDLLMTGDSKKSHAKTFRPQNNLLWGSRFSKLTAKLLISGRVMSICKFESDCTSFFLEEINLHAPPEVDENKL